MQREIADLTEQAAGYADALDTVRTEMGRVIVGQATAIDRMLAALCANGHILLEGVPGIAKTLMVRTLAGCLDCSFARLQFTPDLLPADITGTKVFNRKDSTFSTVKGPIFVNFLLADEINRAPPKVQSALLEAMQERQVTIQGETLPLVRPFLVLATENPIESEGTYPLPEAQTDRFMFKVEMGYPTPDDEVEIMNRFTEEEEIGVGRVLSRDKLTELQAFTRAVYADPAVKRYVAGITHATRDPSGIGLDPSDHIRYGASPRASIYMILGAKALALMNRRGYVIPEDVRAIAHDVLRHRIILTYEAEADGMTPDRAIDDILRAVPVP
ncbi:MAG: MoxR family ATPase [Methanolinea sp.]|nr:MoxR family ATPase [Methanolinea sp.]